MQLYSYYRSTAAYRVRIALNLKRLSYEYLSVAGLRKNDPAFTEHYLQINPQKMVPVLVDGDVTISQSIAIIEYLDETHPEPPLLPADRRARAFVRSVALTVACDIHPLNVMRVRKYLTDEFGFSRDDKMKWYARWVGEGLSALERIVTDASWRGDFCCGDVPTLADICIVPQVYNSRRFGLSMAPYPTLERLSDRCLALPEFQEAEPQRQPDVAAYNVGDEY